MIHQVWTIARSTFTEALRQPIYLVLLLATLVLIGVNPAFSAFTLGEDEKLLVEIGLSTIFVGGLLLAAFTATRVIAEEIRHHTVLSVVAKPVSRAGFLIGKFIGVTAALGVACWIWSAGFLMAVRHGVLATALDRAHLPVIWLGLAALATATAVATWRNYRSGTVFSSCLTYWLAVLAPTACAISHLFDERWGLVSFGAQWNPQHLMALALIAEALAVLSAIAVAASTRLGQAMTLILCSLVFLLGLTSEYLLGRFAESSLLGRGAYALVPNLQLLWLGEALAIEQPVSLSYVALATCYCGAYCVAVLALGTALFQTRDVG
ncbi:MAG: hypothetical protein ACKVX7_09830 [Planctomycetota bacterium]